MKKFKTRRVLNTTFVKGCQENYQILLVFWLAWLGLVSGMIMPPSVSMADSIHVNEPAEYEIGVFPFLPPQALEALFAPIASVLGIAVEKPVLFSTSSSYQQFMRKLEEQHFDVAFVQPFDYVKIAKPQGYVPLAGRTGELNALLVTMPESPIKSVQQLRGKMVALPPISAAVSHLTKKYLADQGLQAGNDYQIKWTRSHMSCMHQVLISEADVCATGLPPLSLFNKKRKVSLRVVDKTKPPIPYPLFVVHSRVALQDRNKMLAMILSWSQSDNGESLLKKLNFNGFAPIKDSAFDVVRELVKAM